MCLSYILYIEYFNRRCENLYISPWDMESYLFRNQAVIKRFRQIVQQVDNHPINDIRLRVYNTIGKNYGKTLLIVNNKKTIPHQTDEVFISFRDTLYEARIGSYMKGNTLRGKDTIKRLIENNRWQPGQEFIVSFLLTEEGCHIFRIESYSSLFFRSSHHLNLLCIYLFERDLRQS